MMKETKKEVLRGYLDRLQQGEELASVRRDFVRSFVDVQPEEIMEAEQSLLRDGVAPQKLQKLCDLHAALFCGSSEEEIVAQRAATERAAQAAPELDGLPEGHPISILRRENEVLEQQLTALFRLLGKKEDGTAFAAAFPRLNALRAHYAKKEELLMPILYRYGVTGPSEVMWGVDDEIKKELGVLTKVLKEDAENVVIYRGRLHDLMTRIREMMVKEERILFPLTVRYFTQEEWYAVYRDDKEFAAVPSADTQLKWEEAEAWCAEQQEALAREEIFGGKVQLETGELTVRQLRALLALFPVDITFIDEDDVLRYFLNEGKIFARPRSALGRKVYECHPPQIIPVVRQMLADFKAKKRDHMVVWRRIMGKPVGVRYQAVYGEDGTYLGTVEFVQDFTEALARFA